MVRIIIGYIGILGLAILAIGSDILAFLDIPSLIMVLGPTFFAALIAWANLERQQISGREFTTRFVTTIGSVALVAGILGALIGSVLFLRQIDTPALIGPSLAVALIAPTYGLLVYLLLLPLRAGPANRANS